MLATDAMIALIDRVHRAALTVATLPPAGPKGLYTLWPAYRLDWWDEGNEVSKLTSADITRRLISPPQFIPTPREIDDCLPALSLLNGVGKLPRRIIRSRAIQIWYGEHVAADDERYAHLRGGWRAVGAMSRCSHTTARKIHYAAMCYALNRQVSGADFSGAGVSKVLA